MVLGLFGRNTADPYLSQPLTTERFDLVPCNWRQAYRLTLPWSQDPETLHALMFRKTSYTRLQWARQLEYPDGREIFYHAIVARDGQETVGGHRIRLTRSGTATMAIALSNRDWWGKGVFEEVRYALIDHFSRSPRVVRFSGRVISRNFSSLYNYRKLGFRLIGYDRKAWRSPLTGELVDTLFFEYLAEDWRAHRKLEVI